MLFNDNKFCIMLQDADFPDYFIHKAHPNDYKVIKNALPVELIYHHRPHHNQLLMRISFKINFLSYIPCTFICDTGAPMFIYINETMRKLIINRIELDAAENEVIVINGKTMTLGSSPSNHPDVNIIGLRALSYFGLILDSDDFEFNRLPNYL